jgi:protein involved in polysaccharide export with SLBB domain
VILNGEVLRPGPYEIREGQTLPEIIAQAGGTTPEALLSGVILQRGGQSRTVDIYDAIKFGKTLNEPVQENDFITVPENKNRVMVIEAVNRQGWVPIPEREKLTVLDAITAAGGFRPDAKTQEVALLRQVGPNKVEQTVLALKDIGKGKNLELANLTLRSGDLIVVPQTRFTPSLWQRATQLVGSISILPSVLGAF